jgi:hypothetical protein
LTATIVAPSSSIESDLFGTAVETSADEEELLSSQSPRHLPATGRVRVKVCAGEESNS